MSVRLRTLSRPQEKNYKSSYFKEEFKELYKESDKGANDDEQNYNMSKYFYVKGALKHGKYLFLKKTKSTFQSAPEEAKSKIPALPNSLLLAMHGEQFGDRHNTELENIMKSRLAAFRHQIPAAENEADKLSFGITSGTPEQVKQSMGERLGTDFSSVKFHTGESISQKADNMGARAWTQGNDVYFGEGGFHPIVAAHELVHTVQQGAVESDAVHVSAPMGGAQMNLKNWFKDICHRIKNCCGCGQQISPRPVSKSKSQQNTGSDNNEVDLFYKNRSLDSSRNALQDPHQTAAAQQQERDINKKMPPIVQKATL